MHKSVPTKLEAHDCPRCLGMLKLKNVLSLKVRGLTQPIPLSIFRAHTMQSGNIFWHPPNANLRTMLLSTQWPHSVTLRRGLLLHVWVATVPKCFYFLILPFTVDRELSRWDQISQSDLLLKWHPIIMSCLNSLSSSEQPVLFCFVQRFVNADCMARCLILHMW